MMHSIFIRKRSRDLNLTIIAKYLYEIHPDSPEANIFIVQCGPSMTTNSKEKLFRTYFQAQFRNQVLGPPDFLLSLH